jgi:hypothetical protein
VVKQRSEEYARCTPDLGLSEQEWRRRDERGEFPRRRGQRADR